MTLPLNDRSSKDPTDNATGTEADDAKLTELTKLWSQHHRKGLEVRHQTGLLLNGEFGPPTVRQAYGSAKLKRYSARLRVAESELSRMRWFAKQFESLADLKARHPEVKTWTQVKELLVSLRDNQPAAAEPKTGDDKKPANGRTLQRLLRSIRAVGETVARLELRPDDGDRAALEEVVAPTLAALGKCLGVEYRPVPVASVVDSPTELDSVRHAASDEDLLGAA